jgi:hypothetical protein
MSLSSSDYDPINLGCASDTYVVGPAVCSCWITVCVLQGTMMSGLVSQIFESVENNFEETLITRVSLALLTYYYSAGGFFICCTYSSTHISK